MTVCVTCGEPASGYFGDAPWAPSADGNGETCSPLCAFRDALRFHHGPTAEDAAARVKALREVVEQEVSPADMPTLRFTLAGPEDCDPAPYVVVGCAFDSSGGFVQIEDMAGEGALLAWSEVQDVCESAQRFRERCSECGRRPRRALGGGARYPGGVKWVGHAAGCSRRFLAPDVATPVDVTVTQTVRLMPQAPYTESTDDPPDDERPMTGGS